MHLVLAFRSLFLLFVAADAADTAVTAAAPADFLSMMHLQHVLTPGHTLEEANLLDGQLVLLEISQQDGAWPRSQLQSMLEAEEEEAMAGTAVRWHSAPLAPLTVWL